MPWYSHFAVEETGSERKSQSSPAAAPTYCSEDYTQEPGAAWQGRAGWASASLAGSVAGSSRKLFLRNHTVREAFRFSLTYKSAKFKQQTTV